MDIDDLDAADDKKPDVNAVVAGPEERLRMLSKLGKYHFFFLAIFSGMLSVYDFILDASQSLIIQASSSP